LLPNFDLLLKLAPLAPDLRSTAPLRSNIPQTAIVAILDTQATVLNNFQHDFEDFIFEFSRLLKTCDGFLETPWDFISFFLFQPHDHQKKVAKFYYATPELVGKAIEASLTAKKEWERIPLDQRMKMFLDVSDQMATKYRADLNATTMLGQAKTVIQVPKSLQKRLQTQM
jgi:hypothetical protein